MSQSSFINALSKKNCQTWNGAISNSTTGSSLVDYFAKCGSYRNRPQEQVDADMASIFAEDETLALKMVFYNRLITRKPKLEEIEKVQRGCGNRDEFFKSLIWLKNNKPDLLYKNLWLLPQIGSWRDLWTFSPITKLDADLDLDHIFSMIKAGLVSKDSRALIAKYLPKIRTGKAFKYTDRHRKLNDFARKFCKYMGWTEKEYRRFKSNPENCAHLWQRQMSANEWQDIDFNKIPGKALFNLVSRTGKDKLTTLQRHQLEEKYVEWIKTKPVAKFTGYVYELYNAAKKNTRNLAQRHTYNAQFNQLLETAKSDINPELLEKGVLCALDTSGSMEAGYWGNCFTENNLGPIDICVGLGIFFSKFLKGKFADNVIMFDNHSRLVKLQGEFCDRVDQIKNEATAWGGTNFQSVIGEIVRVRKQNPDIPVEDYPQILLVVSDMEMNIAEYTNTETNYETAMKKLAKVGLPKMTIIWWQVSGGKTTDFPSTLDDEGTVLISGFDPSIVTAILGGEEVIDKQTGEKRKENPYEVMIRSLDQEILNLIKV